MPGIERGFYINIIKVADSDPGVKLARRVQREGLSFIHNDLDNSRYLIDNKLQEHGAEMMIWHIDDNEIHYSDLIEESMHAAGRLFANGKTLVPYYFYVNKHFAGIFDPTDGAYSLGEPITRHIREPLNDDPETIRSYIKLMRRERPRELNINSKYIDAAFKDLDLMLKIEKAKNS